VKKLSIVIPAYREEGRISDSVQQIDRWLDGFAGDANIRIIVEKSPDKTLEAAREAVRSAKNTERFEVVDNLVHRGKGYAVRSGMLSSTGDYRLFMDADLSVPLDAIPQALSLMDCDNSPDMIIGTRYGRGGKIVKRQNLVRRIGSRCYNLLLRTLGLTGIEDTQCGFKLFTAEAVDIFNECQIDGFGFDIELLLLARKKNLSIKQIPVEWHNSDGSKFNPVRDGIKTVLDAFKVKRRLS
jgi:dolichyl-phosphate beta-glucosyltransferase